MEWPDQKEELTSFLTDPGEWTKEFFKREQFKGIRRISKKKEVESEEWKYPPTLTWFPIPTK